jgi:hypothetical protein
MSTPLQSEDELGGMQRVSTREYPVSTPLQSEDELGAVVQLNASLEKMISAKEVQINVYHRST